MVRRILVAAVLVLTGVGVAAPSTADEPLPALSVDDITMQEPPPEAPDDTVVFTISLDRPAADVVTVWFKTTTSSVNDEVAGLLTFAPGETAQQVAVPVHYDWGWGTGRVVLLIQYPTGATIAKAEGVATLVNIDKAGTFSCGGMGGRVILYSVPNEGGYDNRIADAGDRSTCVDASATGQSYSMTTQGGRGVKPVTITVTTTAIALDAEEPPVPGDTGPFVGDGATARSVPVDVTISEPGGKSIKIEGLWSAVSSHCRALGAEPDLLSTGGAIGVVVNGVRMRDLPDVLALGTVGTVTFGATVRSYNDAPHNHYGRVTRTSLLVTTGGGSVMVGRVAAGYSSYP
jgi:hypothetical protein